MAALAYYAAVIEALRWNTDLDLERVWEKCSEFTQAVKEENEEDDILKELWQKYELSLDENEYVLLSHYGTHGMLVSLLLEKLIFSVPVRNTLPAVWRNAVRTDYKVLMVLAFMVRRKVYGADPVSVQYCNDCWRGSESCLCFLERMPTEQHMSEELSIWEEEGKEFLLSRMQDPI